MNALDPRTTASLLYEVEVDLYVAHVAMPQDLWHL
jgi:hypothetical protein